MSNTESSKQLVSITVEQALQQAISHHKAGRLQDAERLYRAILGTQPRHPDANHNLGVLAVQVKQPTLGLPHFKMALEVNPNQVQYWLSYVDAFIQTGQKDVAKQILEQGRQLGLQGDAVEAMRLRLEDGAQLAKSNTEDQASFNEMLPVLPSAAENSKKQSKIGNPDKQNKLARKSSSQKGRKPSQQEINILGSLLNAGRYTEAATVAQAITERFPHHEVGWNGLGAALGSLGRYVDAISAMQKAVALSPDDVGVRNNMAIILRNSGRPEEAEAILRQILQIKPNFAEAHNNLGMTLRDLERPGEAVASYRRALRIKPGYADAHNNLGNVLKELRRLGEAEVCYRRALQIMPKFPGAYNNLGNVFKELGKLDEAESSYRKALALKPDYAEVYCNLAAILKSSHRYHAALHCEQRAVELNSGVAAAHQGVAKMLSHLSDYAKVTEHSDAALALKADDPSIWENRLYIYSYHPDLSAEEIYGEFVRWGDRFSVAPSYEFADHERTLSRRLRIGYVSPDFRLHTSRFYFEPLFAQHNKEQVELFAYSNVKPEREDDYTERFKKIFDQWRDIRGVSDEDAAALIYRDKIDILVDCCNHMADERLGIFVQKPTPVQVTWLGSAWTTGLATVDYALFDQYMAPEGTLTREKIIRLPGCFVAYRPPEETADVASLPALKNGYVTFGYSGRTERLNHRVFHAWAEILRRRPEARLILDYAPFADPPTQEYYRGFLSKHGIDMSRVTMRKSANIFEGLGDIDILLDSFPHSGGTMLFDALWMGVPALTLAGRPPVGRIGTSLMMNLGLKDWVAKSEEEYIAKACALGQDTKTLADLRAGMRERMRNSPVMDGPGFAKGVEDAYREMFAQWSVKYK